MRSCLIYLIFSWLMFVQPLLAYGQHNSETNQTTYTLNYIPNKGQIADRDGSLRPDVLFKVENQDIYLRKTGISYVLSNLPEVYQEVHEKVEEMEESAEGLGDKSETDWTRDLMRVASYSAQQINMDFLGANSNPTVLEELQSTSYSNYYLQHCPAGVTFVYSSKKVTYVDLYPSINAVFYSNETRQLKYDLIVAPGADPSQIKMVWTGADRISKEKKGELIIENKLAPFSEFIPEVYQVIDGQKVIITADYTLENKNDGSYVVGFKLGKYNAAHSLIIDPWVTNYGGPEVEYSGDVVGDEFENAYLCGVSYSTSAISMAGFQNVIGGAEDAFLVKFNVDGVRLWATYYGGDQIEDATSLACDSDNNIYIGGTTASEGVFGFGGFQNDYGSDPSFPYDAFLAKFSPTGIRLWSTYYGGIGWDQGAGVTVDASDNVYLTGTTFGSPGLASPGAFDTEFTGPANAFLVKFDPVGNRLWATYFAGSHSTHGLSCATDKNENVFLGGFTSSTESLAYLGYDEVLSGPSDCYVAKFDPAGNRLWATYVGGESYEDFGFVACDSADAVYIAGETKSLTDIAYDGFQNAFDSLSDVFLVKFNGDGDRIWGTYYGGYGEDYPFSCEVDRKTNNVLIGGDTYSYNLPVSECALQDALSGTENAFVAQFRETGQLYCASFFGSDHEEDNGIGISGCKVYLTGFTFVNMATPGSHQDYIGGIFDTYLAQLYSSTCGLERPELIYESASVNLSLCGDCDGMATVNIGALACLESESLFDYRWSTGAEFLNTTDTSSTITDFCEGEYWVEISHSCDQIDTIYFSIILEGERPISADFDVEFACVGDSVLLTDLTTNGTGSPLNYLWNFGDMGVSTEENPTHVFVSPGLYTIVLYVTSENGCTDSVSKTIEVFDSYLNASVLTHCGDTLVTFPDGSQSYITESKEVVFEYETATGCDSLILFDFIILPVYEQTVTVSLPINSSYTFPNGETVIVTKDTVQTSYFKQETGCDSIIITQLLLSDYAFLPPNIFSPGENALNDTYFFPQANVATFECTVTNRWGVVVFLFTSITDEWNGTYYKTGLPCADGVYFITYSGTFTNGSEFSGQGTVQLIR